MVHAARIYSRWKPVLVFGRPPVKRARWVEDVCGGEGPEKGNHKWQQSLSEAVYLVRAFSEPGDLVVDPFLGSGTVAVACYKENRRFIGCDIDPQTVANAERRMLSHVLK